MKKKKKKQKQMRHTECERNKIADKPMYIVHREVSKGNVIFNH